MTTPLGYDTGVINLSEESEGFVYVLLGYFYTHDVLLKVYDGQSTKVAMAKIYAKIYAIAENYRVEGLKMRAWGEFVDCLNHDAWKSPEFIDIIPYVWESIPENDKPLRYAILSAVEPQLPWFMKTPRFKEEMDKIEGFWRDLAMYSANFPNVERRYCPACAQQVVLELHDNKIGFCPGCGFDHSAATWRNFSIFDDPATIGRVDSRKRRRILVMEHSVDSAFSDSS
ncbi:hypothetical protein SLS57_003212 [Botryosphaeria dothidea]